MTTIISIDEHGAITLPAEVRRQFRGRTSLEVEVREDGVLLRPAEAKPDDASWVARDVSRSFLQELIRRADESNAHGRDVTPEEVTSWLSEGEAKGFLRRVPTP